MRIAAAAVAVLVAAAFLTSSWLGRPAVDGSLDDRAFEAMAVAPIDEAVTLAVTRTGSVLLVAGVDAGGFAAIDIRAATGQSFLDAIYAYVGLGRNALRQLADSGRVSRHAWEDLGLPVRRRERNIAAGTNYRAHAREVGLDEEPFLFPKLSTPTPWDSPVLPGARLDYEVELCAVVLSDHSADNPADLGYTLCGDFTDRWTLVREIDLDGVMGRTGFASAKGGDSRLPLGPLLVVPADENFYRDLELSLYVGDVLHQRELGGKMVWSPREILDRALVACGESFEAGENVVKIADCDAVPAGTLLLTGTPAGVLFHPATLWNPWAYLREGDVVTSFGTYLGYMRNRVANP